MINGVIASRKWIRHFFKQTHAEKNVCQTLTSFLQHAHNNTAFKVVWFENRKFPRVLPCYCFNIVQALALPSCSCRSSIQSTLNKENICTLTMSHFMINKRIHAICKIEKNKKQSIINRLILYLTFLILEYMS